MARSRSPVSVLWIRRVEEAVGLFLHQPVPYPVAALLDPRHPFDGRGSCRFKHPVVGHLAGELADGREPQVDGRGGKLVSQERGAVLLDQRLGERRLRPRHPDPGEEGRQAGPVRPPGVD